MAKKKNPIDFPGFEIISTSWEILDIGLQEETVMVAAVLCTRIGCENVFKVDLAKWARPWYHEYKNNLMVGRSCPYCFAASRLPLEVYELLGTRVPANRKDEVIVYKSLHSHGSAGIRHGRDRLARERAPGREDSLGRLDH